MRSIRGRKAPCLAYVALLSLGFAAHAESQDVAERAIRLDQTIQALKDEVVELSREAQSVENDVLIPEAQRLSVYLSVGVRGLLLEEVSVAVDDRDPEVHHYGDDEARALLARDSLQRVLRTAVSQGPHRIRITFTGRFADDEEGAPPVTDQYEAIFDKDLRETELEFTITRASRFGDNIRAGMKEWRRQ